MALHLAHYLKLRVFENGSEGQEELGRMHGNHPQRQIT